MSTRRRRCCTGLLIAYAGMLTMCAFQFRPDLSGMVSGGTDQEKYATEQKFTNKKHQEKVEAEKGGTKDESTGPCIVEDDYFRCADVAVRR